VQIEDEDEDVDTTNEFEAFLAISCVDFWGYDNEVHFRRTLERSRIDAPHFGEWIVWNSLPCVHWPGAELRTQRVYEAAGAPPILVVGTTNDPATPYHWSVELAAGLESGVLLTFNGDGHTATGFGNACIDDTMVTYVVDLAVPADGTECANTYGDTFPPSDLDTPAEPEAPAEIPGAAPPPPTGTIRPPDTGSGGEAAGGSAQWLALGALTVGGTGLAFVARGLR
jgi:hypothetical protein